MLNIYSVGIFHVPKHITSILINSDKTFLDADVLIVDPEPIIRYLRESPRGKVEYYLEKRSNEIETLLENGKVVFCFLAPNQGQSYKAGYDNYDYYDIYNWLPRDIHKFITSNLVQGYGEIIILQNQKDPISSFFGAYKGKLTYQAYINDEYKNAIAVNKSNRTISYKLDYVKGVIYFLPYPPMGTVPDVEKMFGILFQCAKPLLLNSVKTEEPNWVKTYSIPGGNDIITKITKKQDEINKLIQVKNKLEEEHQQLMDYRGLLYEQGKPLEAVVIKSLRLFGFKADNYADSEMEHDVIFESTEGRGIAEVEGKDNEPIHVQKLDQLDRVVDEDYDRTGSHAVGVLIGNHFRLKPVEDREEPFTKKTFDTAKRKNLKLLTTQQIFEAVIKVLQDPDNEDLKQSLRLAILENKETIINLESVILPKGN